MAHGYASENGTIDFVFVGAKIAEIYQYYSNASDYYIQVVTNLFNGCVEEAGKTNRIEKHAIIMKRPYYNH